MENTLSIFVETLNQTWELPDDLVIKLEDYKTEHPIAPDNSNADEVHEGWLATLTPQEQSKISRQTPSE